MLDQSFSTSQEEREHALGVLQFSGVEEGECFLDADDFDFDAFILFEALGHLGEIGRDEGVHQFIGHTGGGQERSEGLDVAGGITGFLLKFAAGGIGGRLWRLHGSGGEFPEFAFEGEALVADHHNLAAGAGKAEQRENDDRAWVANNFTADGAAVGSGEGDLLEVELDALVHKPAFAICLHGWNDRAMTLPDSPQDAAALSPPEQVDGSRADAPVIRLVNLHKRFGRQVVLDGISLDFAAGGTTVVLGPSGSGKSVLLKHIVGLLRPDKGEVWFREQRVDRLAEKELGPIRKRVGFLFQLSALFDSMSVRENLEFPLEEHTALSGAERLARVKEALKLVDLEGVEQKFPSQLSGGQQRRVALARAVMLRPEVVLYDEPTTGLDPVRADGIGDVILKFQRELGVTSIVVTHDLVLMRKVANRVVILRDGHVLAAGSPQEVQANEDSHVQNFLAGRYEPDEPETAAVGNARRAT